MDISRASIREIINSGDADVAIKIGIYLDAHATLSRIGNLQFIGCAGSSCYATPATPLPAPSPFPLYLQCVSIASRLSPIFLPPCVSARL